MTRVPQEPAGAGSDEQAQTGDGGIRTSVAGGIGRLVLVNPGRHNALSWPMMRKAAAALDRFAADPAVRVVVVSGHGATFSAGADLRRVTGHGGGVGDGSPVEANRTGRPVTPEPAAALFRSLDAFDRPIVAMVRGYCLGAGVAVALRADIRIATPDSVFGIPAARVGIGYPMPEVRALVNVVGPAVAADLLFTARRIDGVEAHRTGLVTRLADDHDLEAITLSFAEAVAANAPLSVRAAKATIAAVVGTDRPRAAERAEQLLDMCANSRDAHEGAHAILHKRPPVFIGR